MDIKILYAIQGTGNGHITRARSVIPCLEKYGRVDILVSGIQSDIQLPYKIKYKLKGLSFIFGGSGGVDLWKTVVKSNLKKLFHDIRSLPVEKYDLVISDFEPVSAWACQLMGINCVALSNQAMTDLTSEIKFGRMNWLGKLILRKYAPSTHQYGYHFNPVGEHVFPPVIRPEVRALTITDKCHITVYLPSYSEKKLIKHLSKHPEQQWQVFSKHSIRQKKVNNVYIFPLNSTNFINSMSSAAGILCGAGFETPAEALYMQKKLMVIPMKDQYEQQVNAKTLHEMGVAVIHSLKSGHDEIRDWLAAGTKVKVNYPDRAQEMIDLIMANHLPAKHAERKRA